MLRTSNSVPVTCSGAAVVHVRGIWELIKDSRIMNTYPHKVMNVCTDVVMAIRGRGGAGDLGRRWIWEFWFELELQIMTG